MNALCFDILASSFCRKPPVFIFIQDAPGVYPLRFNSFTFNELQTAQRTRVWAVLAAHGKQRVWAVLVAHANKGCGLYLQPASKTGSNPSKMNTYAKCAANPRGMHTSKIVGLKVPCNEHLQKNGGGGGLIVTQRSTHDGKSAASRPSDPADTTIALPASLPLTLAPNGVIPLRGSKLTTEEKKCVDLAI
jgi:hypothetical protein